MTPECSKLVQERTECIYLRTSVDTLVGRLANEAAGRPLLAGADLRNRIDSLMSNRASTYERTAHHIIDTDGLSIDEVAQSLLESVISKLHCQY
jgi:shikimate kinase